MTTISCPCGSSKALSTCCEPFIKGAKTPNTAEELMRSRYVAYCLEDIDYILATTHPSTRSQYSAKDLGRWAKENQWQKLEIISKTLGGPNHEGGQVEFKAHFLNPSGKKEVHHELSDFSKVEGKWFFVKGKLNPKDKPMDTKVGRNDLCPCGSGKKYKKCCGA